MLSRATDDSMKLWDLRNSAKPVFIWSDLPNLSSRTNICFSPDESVAITGTSVRKGFGYGHLVPVDIKSGQQLESIPICQASVTRVLWNEEIDQIVVGCSDGNLRVLYDP
mmetsp:Transcript_45496/g.33273  ORF Transcript_45496/g.33273 Transcript_45496/m.33273 type:complete len:110 (+) Transcript_45496:1104-1433(+)